jgi:hypothetical protein
MIRLLSWMWRWSWAVTVPITVTFLYWTDQTWSRFHTFGVLHRSTTENIRLLTTGEREANKLINQGVFEIMGKGGRGSLTSDDLRLISLFVDEGKLARLNKHLPHSGFQEVKGKIWNGTESIDCKLRYRGDHAHHWAFAKKSWRVKTDRSNLFEGLRKFNLINPKFAPQINNYFGYKLASKMGLIAPRCEMVQLAINGKMQGVHVLVEQLEELTLRQNGYMPGDLYSGELVATDQVPGSYRHSVFEHPERWNKVASNNHYDLDSIDPLQKLAKLCVAQPSEDSQRELTSILNLKAWARFSVYETVTQCFHFDEVHNWRLYYDANRMHFVPIIWDPIAAQPGWQPRAQGRTLVDIVGSRLHALLYQNAEFLRARNEAMREFFDSGMDREYFKIVDDIFKRMHNALKHDVYRQPSSLEEILQSTKTMRRSMEYILTDLRRKYLDRADGTRFDTLEGGICVEVSGRSTVKELRVTFDPPLTKVPTVRVRYSMDGKQHDVDVTMACSVSGTILSLRLGLLAELVSRLNWNGNPMKNHQKVSHPTYYEIAFPDLVKPWTIREIRCDRGNGFQAVVRAKKGQIKKRPIGSLFLALKTQELQPALLLNAQKPIEITKNYEVHSNVIIAPGTRFVMHPGASIRFWGRVHAHGTKEQPILFTPKHQDQEPWGVVALQGPRTSDSVFEHCRFERGSGWKTPYFEYSAMFSVHDSNKVLIKDTIFKNSQVVDDMVHTVYSEIEFRSCHFINSLMDALDMDISHGKVINCVFRNSGNDALDLMTSKVVVERTALYDSGDKGISVGENTTLLTTSTKFVRCLIGIESKDSSQAYVYNSVFDSNKTWAINAFKKNWRYGDGGYVSVYNSQFLNTQGSLNADKNSGVFLENSYLDKPVRTTNRLRLGKLNDIGNGKKRQARKAPPIAMPAALKPIDQLMRPHFAKIMVKRRGFE